MVEGGNRHDGKVAAELARLGHDGENVGGRTLPPLADRIAPANDAVEVWGRRIGRTLGWAAAFFLLLQLIRIYGT